MKTKKIKGWAIIWKKKYRREYGVKKEEIIISVEPRTIDNKRICLPKKLGNYYLDVFAIFRLKKEADYWLKKEGGDFAVVSCVITFKI